MQDNKLPLRPLIEMLNAIQPISAALEKRLLASFQFQSLPAGELLLQEGKVCKDLWFLAEGLLRSFHNIGQKDVTSRIMFNNHIVISPGSFFTQTPATESIEILAESRLCILSFTELQNIYAAFPEFNYHTRIVTEQYFYKQEQRLYMLRQPDALARYQYFLKNYDNFLRAIPQKHIASFLSIAPETLSRIRNKLRKNKIIIS